MKTLIIYLIVLLLPIIFVSFIKADWDWYNYLTNPKYVNGRIFYILWFVIITWFTLLICFGNDNSDPFELY